jgi:excinuclease UvrABC ATPase subunit
MDKTLDPNAPYMRAVLPWRDSPYGQSILKKLAQKYSMDEAKLRHEQPEWFRVVVIDGDNELLRVQSAGKVLSITYHGIRSIIKEQYLKGMLTVDFQAMLSMEVCSDCAGAKLRKESLHVFLPLPTKSLDKQTKILLEEKRNHETIVITENIGTTLVNIAQMQHLPISALTHILQIYQETTIEAEILIKRILTPLRDRVHTIDHL